MLEEKGSKVCQRCAAEYAAAVRRYSSKPAEFAFNLGITRQGLHKRMTGKSVITKEAWLVVSIYAANDPQNPDPWRRFCRECGTYRPRGEIRFQPEVALSLT